MVITSSAPTSRTPSSSNTKSSPRSCAMSWSPTTSPLSTSKRGLDHLQDVRERFNAITGRSAGFQAEWLNVPVDFPLLQRLAHPITIGAVRYPGLKIHEPRIIRLFEVLLHGGPQIGGWTARQIHQAVLDTFDLS